MSELNTQNIPIVVTNVANSLSALETVMATITTDRPALQNWGINVQAFGPDIMTDTVQITLSTPTPTDIGALAQHVAATGSATSVTSSNYLSVASLVLISYYAGQPLSVAPTLAEPIVPWDRYSDTPPWWGGDALFTSVSGGGQGTAYCTAGFGVQGAHNPNNYFLLTAGHCGSHTWYTTGREIGPTSSIYNCNATDDDAQTISVNSSGGTQPYVWVGTSGGAVAVVGQGVPAINSSVTLSGANSGETVGTVNATNQSEFLGNCQVEHLLNIGGNNLGTGGDSGGPVFWYSGGSTGGYPNVKAAGLIEGGNTTVAFAEQIGNVLPDTTTTLLTA